MLTIYRASAGAGKTHTLTGEYLKLLFARPYGYRRILAVTFTNKATDEMKRRIIEELYALSSGQSSGHLAMLCDAGGLTEEQVRTQAKQTLTAILHDYSAFNISTIDRFFQQTMRAFTREIGLQGGYAIEMDYGLVLTEAIDKLLSSLDKPENKALLGWLLRFAEEKIEGGGEWNLRRDITALGKEVFTEKFKALSGQASEDIADKELLEQYKDDLYALIRVTEGEAKRLGEQGLEVLSHYGLHPFDFKGGSRSPLLFLEKLTGGEMKAPSATFAALADNVDGCFTKTSPPDKRQAIQEAFGNGLNDCIKSIVSLFANLTDYNTAKEIARHYYTLGILSDISRQIAAYREEKNVLLIADTTELLGKVIDGSDAPFIYEKTGTRVDHYMIDEFQDTSGMQWHNFLPLLKESLAYKQSNLIVGDVKQSIYRFRNSDWKLLDEQVRKDFPPSEVTEETLKENYRSCRHIVAFNNALFAAAPALLQETYNEGLAEASSRIVSAYAQSYQQVAPPFLAKGGHVRVEFIPQNEEERTWKESALERLPSLLEQLQDNGYPLKDIAILVRKNQEGAMVADTLLTYKEEHPSDRYRYDIISDDALFTGSSPSVRLMVALLRYMKNPDDATAAQMAKYALWATDGSADIKDTVLDTKSLRQLSHLSLYEMTEGIYRLFADRFPDNGQAFTQAFFDLVAEFVQREGTDLGRFLQWWDETGCLKPVTIPDGQNAVRILTVHKSKGLGMKVVIIPFAEWEIDHKPMKPPILWCRPDGEPFDRLRMVPVRYGKALADTRFAADYFNEKLYACVDNLNTLYVACTRAKEELIILAPRPKKLNEAGEAERIDSISTLLWASLSVSSPATTAEAEPLIPLSASFNAEDGLFELGDWWHPSATDADTNTTSTALTASRLVSVAPGNRLRLRLHGKGFFFDDPRRKHGALMHELLSRIRTKADLPTSVNNYRHAGIISREEAEALTAQLDALLDKPEVCAWYNTPTRVLNEVEILCGKGKSRRPDRVMLSEGKAIVVDYKFGEHTDNRYHAQVKDYMDLIRQMGYADVSGYLWYVTLDCIEKVGQ
ncbi:ATP-dependent helicase/nuclease subunit A [Bacteroidales bacterium Barb6XT]|nr:ATP-dependent helicase/nuclease subunit A [Bacteroidales bacterium Barb6XT]